MLEAEVKLRLDAAGRARLLERLAVLGAEPSGEHAQADVYFAHPVRDFATSDEALRLRLDDEALRVTYKGPKLDPPLKTREEIEFGLECDLPTARGLLERLGFRPVATVRKHRVEFRLRAPAEVTVCLDEVEGLGSFCEVECLAQTAAHGRAAIETALAELGLGGLPPLATSYLELLLARR